MGFTSGDLGLLASAVACPAAAVIDAEAYPELPLKAAALLESVARFHPLVDSNKRTAWTLMVLMPRIKGYRHDFSTDEALGLVVGVAAAHWSTPHNSNHRIASASGARRWEVII